MRDYDSLNQPVEFQNSHKQIAKIHNMLLLITDGESDSDSNFDDDEWEDD